MFPWSKTPDPPLASLPASKKKQCLKNTILEITVCSKLIRVGGSILICDYPKLFVASKKTQNNLRTQWGKTDWAHYNLCPLPPSRCEKCKLRHFIRPPGNQHDGFCGPLYSVYLMHVAIFLIVEFGHPVWDWVSLTIKKKLFKQQQNWKIIQELARCTFQTWKQF